MPTGTGVYILECSDHSLYTGAAKDLDRRLQQHKLGKGSKYVFSKRPFKLKYWEACESYSQALKREWQIKKMTRKQKLELVNIKKKRTPRQAMDRI